MRIISRYIFREALIFFAICLATFMGILLTVRMLKLASLVINKGVSASDIAIVFLAIIPSFLEIALPLASLLGVLLAFARLSGDSELVVMRASGISLKELIPPVVSFGVVMCIASFIVSAYLRPLGNQTLEHTLFEIARTKSTSGIIEGVFNKLGALTMYVEALDDESGALRRVVIDDNRDKLHRKIVIAHSGQILANEASQTITLDLYHGSIHEMQDQPTNQSTRQYGITNFKTNRIVLDPSELFTADDDKREKKTKSMYLTELRQLLDVDEQELAVAKQIVDPLPTELQSALPQAPRSKKAIKSEIAKIRLEIGRKFSMPFACIVLALVAIPLGVQPPRTQRTWGASFSIALALTVFVIYYGMLSLGFALTQHSAMPPTLALWLPNIISGIVAYLLLRKISTESWQSIAHGLEQLWFRIHSLLRRRTA